MQSRMGPAQAVAKKQLPWTLSSDGSDERVREGFAQLIKCSPDDVAICQSTSFALTTAARAIALHMRRGDVGLILEDQMSSNVYPWQLLQRTHGLALEAVPYPHDGDWNCSLLQRLVALENEGRRVAVVAIPVYLWSDGSGPVDLVAVCKVCRDTSRRMKTMVVVDATQSAGAVPIDVQQAPVDFLAASVHKWLFGAYGVSCLFVAREWWEDSRLECLVEDEHTRAHMASADDEVPFDLRLPGYPTEFRMGARRLDGGGRPNPILLPMAADGMALVTQWNPARIAIALAPLTKRIRDRCAKELGLWVPPRHGPHFLGVGPGREDRCQTPEEVRDWVRDAAAFLKDRRIYVSARLKNLRVAPHLYTSSSEVDRFVDELGDFVRLRRGPPVSRI
eukprot:TRINITY_DN27770_c0_g1_i2.p1 TRINITY_DN27770_c0_g1~~TRINITY_DN27770_c0_g1_i2.p1  ORF type:complete len:392 (-),score=52.14 TRINITY_DN27770_c0_g1_i2:177-1352(-)